MSMWCPECNRVNYNTNKCDFCDHVMEDTSKSYEIPKTKKPRILNSKPIPKKETSSYVDLLDEGIDELFSKDKKTIKKNFQESIKNTYQDKKSRGDEYEEYIAEHYRKLGCHVIEHGKEQGIKDCGIDLIAELGNEVILIQCKDWNENYSHKIDHKDIKVLRTEANDFLEKNTKYENHQIKLKYTLSGNFLHKSAEKYIEECKEDISYEIIKPTYRKIEQIRSKYIEKPSRKKKKTQGTKAEKLVIGIVSILIILFLLIPKYETKEMNHSSTNKNMIVVTEPNQKAQVKRQAEYDRKLKINQEKQNLKLAEYRENQRSMMSEKKAIENKEINIERQKVPNIQNKNNERLEAKNKLLEQMKL